MELSQELKIKFKRFKSDKRAYWSLIALFLALFISMPAELLCNIRPLILVVDSKPYFPIFFTYSEQDFGGSLPSEPDYKSSNFLNLLEGRSETSSQDLDLNDFDEDFIEEPGGLNLDVEDFDEELGDPSLTLKGSSDFPENEFDLGLGDFEEDGESQTLPEPAPEKPAPVSSGPREYWMLWPPVRYDYKYIPTHSHTGRVALAAPYETKSADGSRIIPSSWQDGHYLGTDDRGRDVLARLIYGFRISMIFGIALAVTGTIIGCLLGGIQGYFGGWIDLIGQRLTEIWGSIPRLYILIILSSFVVRSALLLFVILNLTAWMGIAAYIRAEFLKGRNLEYVKAARALGVTSFAIMRKHILPNSLTPVITFFPFEVTAGILALVSLDFLNLGVPSPAPSMGELLEQGKTNLQALWILLPTFTVLTVTLSLLTFVGDGIRNAFDPRRGR